MIAPKSPAQLTDKISDDDLNNVTGGRKAGGRQMDDLGSANPNPPVLVDKIVQWIKGLFN